LAGVSIYQSGEADGTFYMSIMEEDGTSTDEYYYPEGSYE
jgi:hypothetical protein